MITVKGVYSALDDCLH